MYQPPRKPDHTAARLVEGDRFLAETATLSAELEGRVPADLVADLVRAVLGDSAHDRGVEPTMAEARQRLERFVRVRSSAQQEPPTRTSRSRTQRSRPPLIAEDMEGTRS
jgi:hypothetical protein